jgi:hypothetical protein
MALGGRRAKVAAGAAITALTLLALPAGAPNVDLPRSSTVFRWDSDALFAALEAEFDEANAMDEGQVAAVADSLVEEGEALLDRIGDAAALPYAELERLATLQFELAVAGAARPELLTGVADFLTEARRRVMRAAVAWPADRATHEGLYRVLFGGRIALDEALVQAGLDALPSLRLIEDVPAATPFIEVEGVRVHSGDILLSRGGAPTSALIARGSDFANTFSHAALAYVDPDTGEGTVIESLIETGSVLTSVEEYLESKKHRILVLRLRPDHPALAADPLLPHRAAHAMLERVRSGHIPYDFAMAWSDPSAAFCSEIVYHAYQPLGVELWSMRASMSAPGLVRWLAAMGVREFTTLVPSDLEYDPQLRAVAEWRDAPELMEYRLDNAITDALLEEADRGARLGYAWYALPGARVLKAYSVVRSRLGGVATIPEGMSAATALRVNALVQRVHPALKEELEARAARYRSQNGREAPYWTLVELARESLAARRASLEPALHEGASR